MEAVKNDRGEWVIPASRRPDGTWRKEKLLKDGYIVSVSDIATIIIDVIKCQLQKTSSKSLQTRLEPTQPRRIDPVEKASPDWSISKVALAAKRR